MRTGLHTGQGLELFVIILYIVLAGQPCDSAKLLRPGGLEAGRIVRVPPRLILAGVAVEVGRVQRVLKGQRRVWRRLARAAEGT
eukprot:scaffold30059_cov63-Phaeocystis_antarctica.AAC.1